jgi:hypothetical protein
MPAFRLALLHLQFVCLMTWAGCSFKCTFFSGNKPACSLSCSVGREQIYCWRAANSHKQLVLHVIYCYIDSFNNYNFLLFSWPIKHKTFCFFRYARCTRSVSIGNTPNTSHLSYQSKIQWCKIQRWPWLFAFLQFLRHIMLIWQPSELDSTWSRIPLTVGPWRAVPVALHRALRAAPGRSEMFLSGLSLPSRKTWSASCSTVKAVCHLKCSALYLWCCFATLVQTQSYWTLLYCFSRAIRTSQRKLSELLHCVKRLCNLVTLHCCCSNTLRNLCCGITCYLSLWFFLSCMV